MPYSSEILADTPSSYLRLNETSGTVAADSSGNGNVGTYVGNPTLGVVGLLYGDADTAMETTGNQQLTLPYTFGTNTFTLELWWKWTAPGTPGGIFRDNTAAGGTGYILSANSSGLHVRIAGVDRQVSTVDYQDGLRHHFVLTYDGSTATFYADGIQLDSWSRVAATLPATPLHIGYNGTNSGQYQPGVYDEVALYNYVLSSARVAAHYTAAGSAGPSFAQVEATYLEALTLGTTSTQVEANYLEAMATGTAGVQVESNYLEAMTLVQPAQVESVYAEVVLMGTPPVQIEGIYTEVILQGAPIYAFKGWGVPL